MRQWPVRVRELDPGRLAELEPLWRVLDEHHTRIPAGRGALRARALELSWPRRRAVYLRYLEQPDCFCLTGERDGAPIAYAMVWVGSGLEVGAAPERVAFLTSLVVLAAHRRCGVAGTLMDVVEARVAALGLRQLLLGVRPWNEGAIGFYRARGMVEVHPGVFAKELCRQHLRAPRAGRALVRERQLEPDVGAVVAQHAPAPG